MRRRLRIVHPYVGDRNLTHFGGIFLIQRFCQKLEMRAHLRRMVHSSNLRRNRYQPADLVLAIVYALILGFPRLRKTKILQGNGAFQQIVGFGSYPHASSLRRFLKRIPPEINQGIGQVHDHLRQVVFCLPHPRSSLLFDFDSSVLTVYGRSIEGAEVGYNPHRHGARSYRPLLCFESRTHDFWHGILRPGNMTDRMGTVVFLNECLAKVPRQVYRLRLRADAGFFGREFLEALEVAKIGYVIVAPETIPLRRKIAALSYRQFRTEWEAAEFQYQSYGWDRPRRFVAIRHPLPEKETAQMSLIPSERYRYHVYVTNLPLRADKVWHFYCRRANVELNIRELKEHYALSKIPTKSYVGNQAYFTLLLLAYNIVNWFKRLCLPASYQTATVETIRTEFLVLPARLVNIGNRNVLKLPAEYLTQQLIDNITSRIERLRPCAAGHFAEKSVRKEAGKHVFARSPAHTGRI